MPASPMKEPQADLHAVIPADLRLVLSRLVVRLGSLDAADPGALAALMTDLRDQMMGPAPTDPATRAEDLDGIWVAGRQGHVRVAITEIDWIEAAKDYVLLHTATRRHIHRITMSALEQGLNARTMLRVHRSAFVNPDRIQAVSRLGKGGICLVLRSGAAVPVGPSYVKAVQDRLGLAARRPGPRLATMSRPVPATPQGLRA